MKYLYINNNSKYIIIHDLTENVVLGMTTDNAESKALIEFGGPISLFIYGAKIETLKWIIYNHPADIEIYSGYFRFIAHKISNSETGKKDGIINHTGIIPFESIIPVSQYLKSLKKQLKDVKKLEYFTYANTVGVRYFLCWFQFKYGWQTLPAFMSEYSGPRTKQLNMNLIKSQEDYEKTLQESFIGPVVGFSFGVEEKDRSKKIQEEVVDLLKSLNISNPLIKKEGKIEVGFQAFNKS